MSFQITFPTIDDGVCPAQYWVKHLCISAFATINNMPEFVKTLEEDDEFEDFPEDTIWAKNKSEVEGKDLWEEDWDDDDNQLEFADKLREELKKNKN